MSEKTAEQVVAEALTRVREPEYRISEEEDFSDARIAVAALRDAGMLRSVEHDRQVAEKAWDEGKEAQQAYAAQTASALIRYPEPVKPPQMPGNPYREAVQM